jgi:hypothetical protein
MLERRELLGQKDAYGHWQIPCSHVYDLLHRRAAKPEQHRQKTTQAKHSSGQAAEHREYVDSLKEAIEDLRGCLLLKAISVAKWV